MRSAAMYRDGYPVIFITEANKLTSDNWESRKGLRANLTRGRHDRSRQFTYDHQMSQKHRLSKTLWQLRPEGSALIRVCQLTKGLNGAEHFSARLLKPKHARALGNVSRSLRGGMSTLDSSSRNRVDDIVSEGWSDESPEFVLSQVSGRQRMLLGLPCTRCKAYYDAALECCPICGCKERVSPRAGTRISHTRSRAA